MTIPAAEPQPTPSSIFADDEPVLQSHPLLGGAVVPLFGQADAWDFNGVIRRNANLTKGQHKLTFRKELSSPGWNLTAREIAMVMSNPRHEAVIDAGVHLLPEPFDLQTVAQTLSTLRALARFAEPRGLTAQLNTWRESDFRRFIAALRRSGMAPGTLARHVILVKRLHELGPALSLGGPPVDPWKGTSGRHVAKYVKTDELSTQPVPPAIWFPLVRAAWTYVHDFAPDVLRAAVRLGELRQQMRRFPRGSIDGHLEAWLADPANRIPLHSPAVAAGSSSGVEHGGVNFSLLALMAGADPDSSVFTRQQEFGRRRRRMVLAALEAGHATTTGLIDDLVQVRRADGSTGPWHPGLDPRALRGMLPVVRDAAFCLVAALSMMRDSEIHEIRRGSVVQHYNAPAIASTLDKGHAGKPGKHWWITEPVAEAITVAEAVSVHAERVFAPLGVQQRDDNAVHSDRMIDNFIEEVNTGSAFSGLDQIPAGKVRSHMFRRTMAMLTDQFPGSEIALGLQLKHVAARALANRSTMSYAAADVSWADELASALDAGRFQRFRELFGLHKDGKPIGYGPGAERVQAVFDEILATVKAKGGDARTEEDMLRKARITIRFGTLNNCLFDAANPAGAVCLENAVLPAGHTGPLEERCRPDKCRNSMIGVEHVAIHDSHRRRQLVLLETPRLPKPKQELIRREIERVDAVLAHVRKENQE